MADIKYPEGKYKIVTVGPSDTFGFKGSDGGDIQLTSYSLQLEGVAEWVKLTQKPESTAPQQGDELEGHIEDSGKYGYKFVKKRSGGGFGGGKGFGPGAQYANAVQTAATVVTSYYQTTGTKPKEVTEMLQRIEQVAPMIKSMVDKFAGQQTPAEDKADDKPADAKDGVVIEDVDEKELSW